MNRNKTGLALLLVSLTTASAFLLLTSLHTTQAQNEADDSLPTGITAREYPQTDIYQPIMGTIQSPRTPQIVYTLTDKAALETTTAPIITKAIWGQIDTQSTTEQKALLTNFSARDLKIWPTGTKAWDWNQTGTRHNPGIQPADMEEFLQNVDIVILTRGVQSVLQVPQATIDYAIAQGKTVLIGETPVMIDVYNSLVKQGKRVGGLFHSTC